MSNAFTEEMIARERASQNGHDYLRYHARRFQYVFAKCKALRPDPETRVLDVGRSQLSYLLASHYAHVRTLGFPIEGNGATFGHEVVDRELGGRELEEHIVFDLNQAQEIEAIEPARAFDLIVFAETIEHLYTAPELVLHCLKGLLAPGGLIVCQTPNAAALGRRIKLLLGVHPYERIRFNTQNPGHFREYTKRELIEIGARAGLEVVEHEYAEYFGAEGGAMQRLWIGTCKTLSTLYRPLSRGQTIVYRSAD